MTRLKAFGTHWLASAMVVSLFFLGVVLLWYPDGYLHLEGVLPVMAVLLGVDVVLGPLLMLLLFKPGKKGLWVDVTLILLVQILAFAYGSTTIYTQRPLFTVYYIDRLTVVSAALAEPDGQPMPWQAGPRLVFIPPRSEQERNQILKEVMFNQGVDLERRSQYYEPFENHADAAMAQAKAVSHLLRSQPATQPLVEKALATTPLEEVVYLPIKGREGFMTALFHKPTGRMIAILAIES